MIFVISECESSWKIALNLSYKLNFCSLDTPLNYPKRIIINMTDNLVINRD